MLFPTKIIIADMNKIKEVLCIVTSLIKIYRILNVKDDVFL